MFCIFCLSAVAVDLDAGYFILQRHLHILQFYSKRTETLNFNCFVEQYSNCCKVLES